VRHEGGRRRRRAAAGEAIAVAQSSKLRGVCCPFTYLAQNPRFWNLHNRQDIILTSSKTAGTSRQQLPTPFGIVPGRAAEIIMLCKKRRSIVPILGWPCQFWTGLGFRSSSRNYLIWGAPWVKSENLTK
jgi:hypothetical protein